MFLLISAAICVHPGTGVARAVDVDPTLVIPIHDMVAGKPLPGSDENVHLKGYFYISQDWQGHWWKDGGAEQYPKIYTTDLDDTDARPLPLRDWTPVLGPVTYDHPAGEPQKVTFDAIVSPGTASTGLIAIELRGLSDHHSDELGVFHAGVVEKTFVINTYETHTTLKSWSRKRQLQEGRKAAHALRGPFPGTQVHIFSDTVIPIDVHRPWNGEPAQPAPQDFWAYMKWLSKPASYGWKSGAKGPVLGSQEWKLIHSRNFNAKGGRHGTLAHNHNALMVFFEAYSTVGSTTVYESQGVIRDLR